MHGKRRGGMRCGLFLLWQESREWKKICKIKPPKNTSACDNGGRQTEGCHAFSVKRISMTQCKAWWPTFLFHSGSLSTVALHLGATTTPVRFNRVYSKVTAGTLSVVSFCYLLPQCMNWSIRLMDCPCSHNRGIFSLYPTPPALLVSPSLIETSAFDYLSVNASRRLTSLFQCHQQDILLCSLRRDGGWESGLAHIWTKQGLGWEETWRREYSYEGGDKGCEMLFLFTNAALYITPSMLETWAQRECIKGSVGGIHIDTCNECICFHNWAGGLIARPRNWTKRSFLNIDASLS